MKIRKNSIYVIFLILVMGLVGCANQKVNNNEKIEIMTRYAEERYGKEFEVEYFSPALDSSYTNTLTLSDGEIFFNVLGTQDCSKISDDYASAALNNKLKNYLMQTIEKESADIEIYSRLTLITENALDYEYVKTADLKSVLTQGELLKIFVIVRTSGDIKAIENELFKVYNAALILNPEVIEFQTISCDAVGDDLEKVLTNMNEYYDREWEKYDEIKSYFSVREKDIQSAEQFVNKIEQKDIKC